MWGPEVGAQKGGRISSGTLPSRKRRGEGLRFEIVLFAMIHYFIQIHLSLHYSRGHRECHLLPYQLASIVSELGEASDCQKLPRL